MKEEELRKYRDKVMQEISSFFSSARSEHQNYHSFGVRIFTNYGIWLAEVAWNADIIYNLLGMFMTTNAEHLEFWTRGPLEMGDLVSEIHPEVPYHTIISISKKPVELDIRK